MNDSPSWVCSTHAWSSSASNRLMKRRLRFFGFGNFMVVLWKRCSCVAEMASQEHANRSTSITDVQWGSGSLVLAEAVLKLAVGIDVGFSASKRSTGVAVIDRATRTVVSEGLFVDTSAEATRRLLKLLGSMNAESVHFAIDGPFASAVAPTRMRLVERFFSSGPFASAPSGGRPALRLMPANTPMGSPFLASTRTIADALVGQSHREARLLTGAKLSPGNLVEIFPTVFMAMLLPPHAYNGDRGEHTDDLWNRLVFSAGPARLAPIACLRDYVSLIEAVELAAASDRHDLRAAAVSAIAADWHAGGACEVGNKQAISFMGTSDEFGFLLPPREKMDPTFAALLDEHWSHRPHGLSWTFV